MVKVSFLGGVGEIGGSKFLVEDKDTKILLNFGMNFSERSKFYSEPFNEEMEIEYNKFVNWLDHFGLPMYHIHCSGHIMPTEIKQVISEISPKTLFPIHTEHPELFGKFAANVTHVTLPQRAKTELVT